MPDSLPSNEQPSTQRPVGGLQGALQNDKMDISASLGGGWGIAESVLPLSLFSLWYPFTQDLWQSSLVALALAALFSLRRLVRGEPLQQALGGIVAIGLGAYLANRSGQAKDMFLVSIYKNIGFGLAYALSAAVRWPVVGVMVGPLLGEDFRWRDVPARRRVYSLATWMFVGMFAIRLLYQVPLYVMDKVALLGLLAVPAGIPLFAVTVFLAWRLIRAVPTVSAEPTPGDQG